MTQLTDADCRRLVELLDEHGSGDIGLWRDREFGFACKTRMKRTEFKGVTAYAKTASAALLAALEKVNG